MGQEKSWQQQRKDAGYRACTLWFPEGMFEVLQEVARDYGQTVELLISIAVLQHELRWPKPSPEELARGREAIESTFGTEGVFTGFIGPHISSILPHSRRIRQHNQPTEEEA